MDTRASHCRQYHTVVPGRGLCGLLKIPVTVDIKVAISLHVIQPSPQTQAHETVSSHSNASQTRNASIRDARQEA
jgi:hypothetical protein